MNYKDKGLCAVRKFLANIVSNTQIMFIGDYVLIVGSSINAIRPPLVSDSASNLEFLQKMRQKSEIKKIKPKNPLREMFIYDTG